MHCFAAHRRRRHSAHVVDTSALLTDQRTCLLLRCFEFIQHSRFHRHPGRKGSMAWKLRAQSPAPGFVCDVALAKARERACVASVQRLIDVHKTTNRIFCTGESISDCVGFEYSYVTSRARVQTSAQ